jgi:hypothetical protein
MKSQLRLIPFTFIGLMIGLGACQKEEAKPAGLTSNNLQGSWAITSGEGTEWQKDVGIITPRADDPSLIGYKMEFSGNMMSVKDISGTVIFGPSTWNLDETAGTILIGTDAANGLGFFTIKNFVAGASMDWDQRNPVDDDYEYKLDCDCFLYFQKFLKFNKVP